MPTIRTTPAFDAWLAGLRDRSARDRIIVRLRRLSLGNPGDVKYFEGIGELRIDHGPGYRVYFVVRDDVVVLCGGSKKSQSEDIASAKRMVKEGFT